MIKLGMMMPKMTPKSVTKTKINIFFYKITIKLPYCLDIYIYHGVNCITLTYYLYETFLDDVHL